MERVFTPGIERYRAPRVGRPAGRSRRDALDLELLVESRSRAAVRQRERVFRRALVAADLLASLLVAGLVIRLFGSSGPRLTALTLLPIVVTINAASGLYKRDELLLRKNTLDEAPALFQAATVATVVAFLFESVVLATPIGARPFALTWLALTVIVVACRVAARAVARSATAPERCLVLGDAEVADRLESKIAAMANVKATFVGRIPLDSESEDRAAPGLGTLGDLPQIVLHERVHRVIVAGDAHAHQSVLDAIQSAKALGVRVSVLPRMFDAVGSSVAFDYLDGLTLLGVRRFGLSTASRRLKRAFDVIGSLVCIVLLAPLMAAIAIAIKVSSRGPVLFRQTRVGRNGQTFQMLKYRSMYDGADARKSELRSRNEADGLFKIADDPRVTRVGRFLRSTALDELPQLFNVLAGQMSLVGPRPLWSTRTGAFRVGTGAGCRSRPA